MTTLDQLLNTRCAPTEQGLTFQALNDGLAVLPGWEHQAACNSIVRQFHFADYYETMAFVNALAYIAHQEDHHPDLSVSYNRCVVAFNTHSAGGISINDLICAAKLNHLLG
jgi:4a-hydroxytetrahydrobiopterin dehydratase